MASNCDHLYQTLDEIVVELGSKSSVANCYLTLREAKAPVTALKLSQSTTSKWFYVFAYQLHGFLLSLMLIQHA